MNTKTILGKKYVIREPLLIAEDELASPYADKDFQHSGSERVSSVDILERYYNDLYKHLIATLASFDSKSVTTPDEATKLRSLLEEFLKVKSSLEVGQAESH